MTDRFPPLLSQFLGEELSAAENDLDKALFEVICCGLEKTVSYGTGTGAGPAAIITASHQLERLIELEQQRIPVGTAARSDAHDQNPNAAARPRLTGSVPPTLAATVISLESFENSLDRAASWRPLRCMMFLNCECPAMSAFVQFN